MSKGQITIEEIADWMADRIIAGHDFSTIVSEIENAAVVELEKKLNQKREG